MIPTLRRATAWGLAALLGIAACVPMPDVQAQADTGLLELLVDASALGDGGNIPAAQSATRQAPSNAGWTVHLVSADGTEAATIVTDYQGLARTSLPAGSYQAVIPGNPALKQTVRIAAGQTTRSVLHLVNATP